MITKEQFANDFGPSEVFIFYSFLLFDEQCKSIKVHNAKDLRKVFVAEYRKLLESHRHLLRSRFKEAFVGDLARSYFHIKNKMK